MQTDVTIPDDIYAEAEGLLRRLNISRSELYASALREYLARHDSDAITAALNRVYGDGDIKADPAVLGAGVEALKRNEW